MRNTILPAFSQFAHPLCPASFASNMADTYLFFIILLFVLAAFDLMVGVSNDAVNFLNSAIGSKVAKRHVIMIVASIGIFIGAAFSSGMMEVARKSIFYPDQFTFEEIMVVFMAVMLTDIILLDLFNTFGMPTSTTVSIVFELLGGAVAVAMIKMLNADEGMASMSNYINFDKAGEIVVGILLSVVVAFSIGSILMYLSRLLFSFQVEKKLKNTAPIWGGLAMAAMSYFLFAKGLKNVDVISDFPIVSVGADELSSLCGDLKDGKYPNCFFDSESNQTMMYFSAWLKQNFMLVIGILFVFWAIVLKIAQFFTKGNVLRFVVLFGTFSLAMAFAGNDLVNFIGVPVAGFESFNAWVDGGMDIHMSMEALGEKVPTQPLLLFLAGAIMVLTLWLSKKARSVTETEVKLGRQDEGAERFKPNFLSRGIVVGASKINRVIISVLPEAFRKRVNKSFALPPRSAKKEKEEGRAFDLIRASVNLSVASMIITYASSRKLPLSTTYVSFMVAMGASLADRAWGRDSAVFRIAGVINVIMGWFGTALIAFTVSAVFAVLIWSFQIYAVIGLVMLAAGLLIRSNLIHRKMEAKKEMKAVAELSGKTLQPNEVLSLTRATVIDTLLSVKKSISGSIDSLVAEDRGAVRRLQNEIKALKERNEASMYGLFGALKRIEEDNTKISRLYLKVFDLEQDLIQSSHKMVEACTAHIANIHAPLEKNQARQLQHLKQEVVAYLESIAGILAEETYIKDDSLGKILTAKEGILHSIENILDAQTKGIRGELYNSRNSMLNFTLAFEMKDLVAVSARFIKLYHREEQLSSAMPVV